MTAKRLLAKVKTTAVSRTSPSCVPSVGQGPRAAVSRARVSVSRRKAHMSAYLTKVQSGLTVVVTNRGRPVARIEPVTALDNWELVLERLAKAGLVRLPTTSLGDDFFERPNFQGRGKPLPDALPGRREGDRTEFPTASTAVRKRGA